MPPVYPIEWLPTSVRGRWPHMAKRDSIAWGKYLDAHAGDYAAFAYDLALGGVRVGYETLDPASAKGWQYNTALKIDAVGRLADRVVLFEVRPEAQCSAIGAVICYAMVCRRDDVFDVPIYPAIVCEYMQPDVEWVANQLGVTVHKVPA